MIGRLRSDLQSSSWQVLIHAVAVGTDHNLNLKRKLKANYDSARSGSMQRNALSFQVVFLDYKLAS